MNDAPTVTPEQIENAIVAEHYFTGQHGCLGAATEGSDYADVVDTARQVDHDPLALVTFCILVLENGFTVVGTSACASPERFDYSKGREIARENAVEQIWPLEGYRLRQQLFEAGH